MGVAPSLAPIIDLDQDSWDLTIASNLTSVWLSMKYEIGYMRGHGGGAIVNTSSIPTTALPGHGAYGAAKAGVSALTRAAAREHLGDGIRINAVCPGPPPTGNPNRDRDFRDTHDVRSVGLEVDSRGTLRAGLGRSGSAGG